MIKNLPSGVIATNSSIGESINLSSFEYDPESMVYFANFNLKNTAYRKPVMSQANNYYVSSGSVINGDLKRYNFTESTTLEFENFKLLNRTKSNEKSERSFVKMAEYDVSELGEKTEEKDQKEILREQFESGVRNILDSNSFKSWCETRSKLFYNNYSLINSTLISMQKQNASHVMGYEQWKSFGRQVSSEAKGNGIKIFQPVFVKEFGEKGSLLATIKKAHTSQFAKNSTLDHATFNLGNTKLEFIGYKNGLMDVNFKGKTVMAKATDSQVRNFLNKNVIGKMPAYYGITTVFDLEHVVIPEYLWLKTGFEKSELTLDDEGNPVKNKNGQYKIINTPERIARFKQQLDWTLSEHDPDKMNILFDSLVAVSEKYNIPVHVTEFEGGAEGFYSSVENSITIRESLTPTNKVAAMFHEMAHSKLHRDLAELRDKMPNENIDRNLLEMQAEASSYIVAQSFGINTSTMSFPYIAVYSKGRELKEIERSLDLIISETRKLTSDIKQELFDRGYDMNIEQDVKANFDPDKVNSIIVDTKTFCINKFTELQGMINEISEELNNSSSQRETDILHEQLDYCNKTFNLLSNVDSMTEILEKDDSIEKTISVIDSIKFETSVIESNFSKIDKLGEERVNVILEEKKASQVSVKDAYKADKLGTLNELKKTNPLLQQMSDSELEYISKSVYVRSKLQRFIGKDTEKFVNECAERINAIREVASTNGVFVEVNSMESWETEILSAGSVLNPYVANEIISKLESKVRELKVEAVNKNDFYPYVKTDLSVFYLDQNGSVQGNAFTIKVGDGYQNDMVDFFKKNSKSFPLDIIEQSISSFALEKQNVLMPKFEKDKPVSLKLEQWKIDVSHLREVMEEQQREERNEKELSNRERG